MFFDRKVGRNTSTMMARISRRRTRRYTVPRDRETRGNRLSSFDAATGCARAFIGTPTNSDQKATCRIPPFAPSPEAEAVSRSFSWTREKETVRRKKDSLSRKSMQPFRFPASFFILVRNARLRAQTSERAREKRDLRETFSQANPGRSEKCFEFDGT